MFQAKDWPAISHLRAYSGRALFQTLYIRHRVGSWATPGAGRGQRIGLLPEHTLRCAEGSHPVRPSPTPPDKIFLVPELTELDQASGTVATSGGWWPRAGNGVPTTTWLCPPPSQLVYRGTIILCFRSMNLKSFRTFYSPMKDTELSLHLIIFQENKKLSL